MGKQLFERHFAGRDNAGLRALIRRTALGSLPACGPKIERAVLSIAGTTALQGPSSLLARAAADYRAVRSESDPDCDCAACLAGGLQYLGASGGGT